MPESKAPNSALRAKLAFFLALLKIDPLLACTINLGANHTLHSRSSIASPKTVRSSLELSLRQKLSFKQDLPAGSTFTGEELLACPSPEPNPIVTDLLFKGQVCLIAGPPKMGKSRLILSLCDALTNTDPGRRVWLGKRIPARRKVIYYDLENGEREARERYRRMLGGLNPSKDLIFVIPPTLADHGIDLLTIEGLLPIAVDIGEHQAEVIVIDALRLAVNGNLNDGEVAKTVMINLSRLRRLYPNLVTIVIHHTRKIYGNPNDQPKLLRDPWGWFDRISGSNALTAHANAVFGLDRDGTSLVFAGVNRSSAQFGVRLDSDDRTLRFSPESGESLLHRRLTPAERKIWSRAQDLSRFRVKDLEKKYKFSRKMIGRTMKKAEQAGCVVREPDRQYRLIAAEGADCTRRKRRAVSLT